VVQNLRAPHTELASESSQLTPPAHANRAALRDHLIRWFENAIFVSIAILVIAIPHPTPVVLWGFRVIWLLWVVRLLLGNNHLRFRPLYLPIFVFVALVFLSTVHSYEPLLSWDRIERFTQLLIVLPIAENLKSVGRIKLLIALLLASSMISAMRTGWQYVHGIGTKLVAVVPRSALGQRGVLSDDIVQEINGYPTRTPEQWRKALEATHNDAELHLRLARAWPYYERVDRVVPRAALDDWLAWPGAKIARGRPMRAQGHFYHYVPYAGLLMELGLIAFGLLLTCPVGRIGLRLLLGVVFAGLLACLVTTLSRAHLGALLVACLVMFCIQVRGWLRAAAVAAFVVAMVVGAVWLRKERGVSWYSQDDAGTQFRLLMWRDSPRLIREHPLLGIGPDSELGDTRRWNLEAYRRYPLVGHFHSSPIEIAVTCGLPALAALVWLLASYCSLLIGLLRRFERRFAGELGTGASLHPTGTVPNRTGAAANATNVAPTRAHDPPPEWFPRGLVLGFLGGAIALVISSFVHYIVGDAEVMILVWACMAIAIAITKSTPTSISRC
jgi:O-Antigen ligase